MLTKVFESETSAKIEQEINNWLSEQGENIEVIDIKWMHSYLGAGIMIPGKMFSALILYKKK